MKTFGLFVKSLLTSVNDLPKLLRDLWDVLMYIIFSLFAIKYRIIEAIEKAKRDAILAITARVRATKDLALEIFPARIALPY